MALQEDLVAAFERHYKSPPTALVRAPGRVNLIGEHTDYNDGFVLPLAIDRAVWIALRPAPDGQVRLYSLDFDAEGSFDLGVEAPRQGGVGAGHWIEYVKGVAWALKEAGYPLRGWQGAIAGDVPMGAGLASSAALEMAAARSFAHVGDLPWDPPSMARLGQRAENRWVGVNCGIMDQMISASGRRDHALLLDCRSLVGELVPLPKGTAVLVLDTGTRRGLVDSAYNERRAQCEAAAAFFAVPALRDVDADLFAARMGELDDTTRRRARHVVGENARTEAAARVMAAGDARVLGALMDASHASLRDDFEVSSPALDTMVECARSGSGCYGARMTGAGFGGCAVALVEVAQVEAFVAQVEEGYIRASGETPRLYVCRATDGVAVL